MNNVPGHTVILASAGTGKTFQLTNRFLALLARGTAPERILGTTFTRKAAGEILDRILARLAAAAGDDRARAELEAHLAGPALDEARCRELLRQLVRSVDGFHVETLDAFFLRLATVFGLELGLPPGWQLVDDADDVAMRSEAVAAMLDDTAADEMLALLTSVQRGGEGRSIHRALLGLVEKGHDVALNATDAAWGALALPQPLSEEAVAEQLAIVEASELPTTGKVPKPHGHWVRAHAELIAIVRRRDWEALLGKGLGKKVADAEDVFHGKPFPAPLRAAVERLVGHATTELLAAKAREGQAWRELLARFDVAYARLKRLRRTYRFDDLPRALARARTESLSPWRLGADVDHLLLDEFQDTSVTQWRVLQPLAGRLLADRSGTRSFFCVGDVKQSIYGWRGAEPRLLTDLSADEEGRTVERLARSYRSSAVVLDTVNQVFGHLPELPILSETVLASTAQRWDEAYETHTAAHPELPGSCALHEVPVADGASLEEGRRAVTRRAVAHVADLVRTAPGSKVGVLVRHRRNIGSILYELRRTGLRASDEGGNPLTDSDVVLVALSLLHLADHPGDSMAYFHVATSPFAEELGATLTDRDADRRAAREVSARIRRQLLGQGYGETLAALAPAVARHPGWGGWDESRFAQLVDAAFAWDQRAGLRPADFVRWVRQTKVEDPRPSAVQVMTVHASKGLEFDAVVLPDLEVPLEPNSGEAPLLWRRRSPSEPVDLVFPRTRRRLARRLPELDALLTEARQREITEELCVLYVAMTRAIRRLDLFVASVGDKTPQRQATLLRQALDAGAADEQGVVWRHPASSADWHTDPSSTVDAPPAAAGDEVADSPAPGPVRLAPSLATRERRRRPPSSLEGGRRTTAHELLRPMPSGARARGLVVHRWMAEIEWLDDFSRDEGALVALAREVLAEHGLLVDAASVDEWLAAFRAALEAPRVRAVLSRGADAPPPSPPVAPSKPVQGDLFAARPAAPMVAPSPASNDVELEVWRERPFAVPLDDELGRPLLVGGAFDRVVLTRSGGQLVAARILDFKTDRVDGEVPGSLVERYRPQMQEYRRVLAVLTDLDPSAITATLVFLAADALVDIG